MDVQIAIMYCRRIEDHFIQVEASMLYEVQHTRLLVYLLPNEIACVLLQMCRIELDSLLFLLKFLFPS